MYHPARPSQQNKRKYMKKALITMTTLAVLGATAPRPQAHDRGLAVAGGVIAGVGAGLVLSRALEPRPVVYESPVVVSQPAPVVVQQPAQQIVVQQPVQ